MCDIKKVIRTATKVITSVAVIAIVIFAILVVGVKLFDLDVYIVLSPSMEPEIKTGSIIYTKDAVISELEKGDIITFSLGGEKTATHRIDEVIGTGENKSFVTKGDANDNVDGKTISASEVVGVCVFWLPYLGYVIDYIQSPVGLYVSIGTVAFIIVLMMLPDILFGEEEKKEKKKKRSKKNAVVEDNNNEENGDDGEAVNNVEAVEADAVAVSDNSNDVKKEGEGE